VFERATFGGPAVFAGAKFPAGANFRNATFSGDANFRGAVFGQSVDFSGTVFERDATLSANFSVGANLSARYRQAASFHQAHFGGPVTFEHAEFDGPTSFSGTDFSKVTIRGVEMRYVSLSEAENVDKAKFQSVVWAKWPVRHIQFVPQRNAIAEEIAARTGHRLDQAEGLRSAGRVYHSLWLNMKDSNDQAGATEFYFAEMEMRRLASHPVRKTKGRYVRVRLGASMLRSEILQRVCSLHSLYGLFSGYGERWRRGLLWLLLLWVACGLVFARSGIWVKVILPDASGIGTMHQVFEKVIPVSGQGASGDTLAIIRDALIQSFLVATLIGRDAFATPDDWVGVVTGALESAVGPLLLALTALAVRRKFQR
jgi:hypothetical protein